MDDIECAYEYKPKWTFIVFCALFSGLGAVVLGVKAAHNDRGVIINYLLELGHEGATIFYSLIAACCGGFMVIAAFLAYHRLRFRQRLAFRSAAITVPRSRWSDEEEEIAYRDISELSPVQIAGQRFLHITHPGGKFVVNASMLANEATFEEVRALLDAKVRAAQDVAHGRAKLDEKADRPRV